MEGKQGERGLLGEGLRDQASGLGICWTGKVFQAPGRGVRGPERMKEVWYIDSKVPEEHLSRNAFYYVLKPHLTPRLWKAEFTQNFPQGGTSLGTGTECANGPYPCLPPSTGADDCFCGKEPDDVSGVLHENYICYKHLVLEDALNESLTGTECFRGNKHQV